MCGDSTFFDADLLHSATFVRHVEVHDSLPSTNDRAIELSTIADFATPALIVAREQTAGRGRGKHAWWSADGALTFSLVLDTADHGISQREWPRLSLTTAVAICDALIKEAPSATLAIKWPNDVLINGAKVAGILIESPNVTASTASRLIIGIGVNVNNSWQNAPQDAVISGTAICDLSGQSHDLTSVLISILQAIQQRLHQLSQGESSLIKAWQAASWLTKRPVEISAGNRTFQGTCHGVDSEGALLVEIESEVERFFSGSVRAL